MMREALDASVEIGEDTIELLLTGYDLVHLDVVEAPLVFDSHVETAGVRSGTGPRSLVFEHGELRLSFELDEAMRRCSGSVTPPGGVLYCDQVESSLVVAISESGSFDTGVERRGPFRLRYHTGESAVATPWLRFGPTSG